MCTYVYDFNALANWLILILVVARISFVTSKLQAIAEKKRGGSDVSEARRDYGRRNIAVDAAAAAAVANALYRTLDANRKKVGCNGR